MQLEPETSLTDAFAAAAAEGGTLTILGKRGEGATKSHVELIERAEGLAARLLERGVEPGDVVGMVANTTFDFVIGCMGTWRAGGVVASLPVGHRFGDRARWAEGVNRTLAAVGAELFLSDEETPRFDVAVPVLDSLGAQAGQPTYAGPTSKDMALLQFSSGSTSAPKGVLLSHSAVTSQLRAVQDWINGDPKRDHLFSWLPLYHDLGFITILLFGLAIGIRTTLMPTMSFLSRPTGWLEGMSNVGATVTYAPNFAFGLAARGIESGRSSHLDLSAIRLAATGGEAVDVATMERFLRATEPMGFDPRSLAPGYGLAEATCVCTMTRPGTGITVDLVDRSLLSEGVARPVADTPQAARFVSVGPALAEFELSIRDKQSAVLPERSVGEVWVKGPALMEEYMNDPTSTASVMTDSGWLRTGDLGYLVDNELYITGRAKDMIIVRGQNYFAEDIERVAAQDEDVRKGSCVAFPISDGSTEQVVIAAETRLDDDAAIEALRRRLRRLVREEVGLMPADVVLLPPSSIPKTTSGKLQRRKARHLYESGAAKESELGSRE